MVNLKVKPYCLDDEQIKWVNDTIASMTDEEKVGQLFFQLTAGIDEAYLKELMEKYHLGGCRYNNMPSQAVKMQNATLQKYAKIPLLIACNTENGGNGACSDGTPIASCIKIGATRNNDYARALGKYSNKKPSLLVVTWHLPPFAISTTTGKTPKLLQEHTATITTVLRK